MRSCRPKPSHFFEAAIEASPRVEFLRLVLLTVLPRHGTEPWRLPTRLSAESLSYRPDPPLQCRRPECSALLARREPRTRYCVAIMPGLMHRIGGIEKSRSGTSYDPKPSHMVPFGARGPNRQRHPRRGDRRCEDSNFSSSGGVRRGVRSPPRQPCSRRGLKVARLHLVHLNPFRNFVDLRQTPRCSCRAKPRSVVKMIRSDFFDAK